MLRGICKLLKYFRQQVGRQPVALVDFCAISNAKIPIIGAALRTIGSPGVCKLPGAWGGFCVFFWNFLENYKFSPRTWG
jgi:hypothetical protein